MERPDLSRLAFWRTRNEGTTIRTSQDLDVFLRNRGMGTASGMSVNASTARNYSAFWAATRMLAEDIAKLPLILYERDAEDPRRRQRALTHPLYPIFRVQANPWQTAMQFRELMMQWVLVRGDAFAVPTRVRGQIRELLPVDPSRVRIEQDDNFRVSYELMNARGQVIDVVAPNEIVHLMGPSVDGLHGMSVLDKARESIGLGLATEKYGAEFFGEGGRPPMTVSHPATLSDSAYTHLDESLNDTSRRRRTLLLEEGLVSNVVALQNDDAQFLETRLFQVDEIARWFRIPPHKLQQLLHATFSNIESQSREYVTDSLQGWATRWEQELQVTLLGADSMLFVEHLFDALLRGNTLERFQAHKIAAGPGGWMTRNEIREINNLNPGPPELDEYLPPANTNLAPGEEPAGAAPKEDSNAA